jgi:predicted Zn-dependent protease with MMP-like domain/predicted negative regulator of RcsB-dependent stress response
MSLTLEHALQLAEQALEAGELEDALAFSEQALLKAPNDLDALEIKGLALSELGEWERADEAFETLLVQAPGHVTGLISAADVKIRQPGDDRERIGEGLELLERAEPKARKDEAFTIELELLRGVALNQLGDFEGALDAFARVLHLDPDNGEAQLEQAICLFEQGRFGEAKKAFERLGRDFPEDAWSFHYLGLLAERRGEDPEPFFSQARAIDPDEFPPSVHMTAAEFDAAVDKAIAALPEHARPHLANAIVNVEPLPTEEEIKEGLSPTILGVFHGTPIDERLDTAASHHETVRITLYQKNLERFARTKEELEEEIRITVLHEVGHLLGLDEDELYERGLD